MRYQASVVSCVKLPPFVHAVPDFGNGSFAACQGIAAQLCRDLVHINDSAQNSAVTAIANQPVSQGYSIFTKARILVELDDISTRIKYADSTTLVEQTSTIMEIIDEEFEVDLSGHLDEEFLVNGN